MQTSLVTSPALLGNDGGECLHLRLGAAECAQSSLDELPGALVL